MQRPTDWTTPQRAYIILHQKGLLHIGAFGPCYLAASVLAGVGGHGGLLPCAVGLQLSQTPVALEATGPESGPARPSSYRLNRRGAERLAGLRRQSGVRGKVALYARVSTHAGQNPEMQVAELREYCQRRDWEIAGEYVDVGISGAKERRPELDRLLAECRRGRVDAVVVYRYDRFTRSLRQLVNALCEFDALRIQFVSLHEGVDTSTPNGRLVFGIFASIAEFERELIRERVRSGMAAARARGARIGRPRKPMDADKVAELRAQGASWRAIARQLGVAWEQFAGQRRNVPETIR